MRLQLLHPAVAKISCDDCKQWVFDFETGERVTYLGEDAETRVPQKRGKNMPPPCGTCPKISPEREKDFQLSDKNRQTWELYRQSQATFGRCLWGHECNDETLARNFGHIDQLMRELAERRQREAQELMAIVAGVRR